MKKLPAAVYAALTCSLSVLSPLAAQTAPASSSDQPVRLQDFTVSAGSQTGYVASESTTGTRVVTKVADLPFVVNVITSEFLNDFDFFSLSGNVGYVSSLSQLDTEGNANLRGFPSTFQLWNGFYRLGLVDRVDLDRIEVIKGPNAGIYGQTSPSGIINYITRMPTDTGYEDLTLTYGSFKTARLEGHVDTPVGSVAGVQISNLISFDGMDNYYDTPYQYEHQRSLADSLKLKINDHSTLLLQVDWYKNLSNTGDSEGLFNYNSVTKAYIGTPAPINLSRFSQGGPNERQNREFTDFYSTFENRFSEVWSLHMGAYGYDRHNSEVYNGVSNEFDPALGEVVGISTKPTRTILNEDGGAAQADLLAHWYLFNHTLENKTLFTLDYTQNWRYREGTTLPSTLQKFLPSVQNPNAPNYNNVPDYPSWTIVNRNDRVRWDTDGIFMHEEATLLDNRLFLFAGMRHDQVTYNLNFGNQYSSTAPYPIATPGQVQHFVNSAWTPAGGANFKLTSNIALYANYSQSFQASAQSAKLGDQPLPNTRGFGGDYGVKANFMDNRLIFTIGGYYVTETGIKINMLEPDGTTESVAGGSQNSRGVESDMTFVVTKGLYLAAGFGYVNARLLNEGTDTAADGLRPPMIPVDNGYMILHYAFSRGPLTGFAVNFGLRYDGVSYPYTTATTLSETTLRIPSYYSVDGGITYTWTRSIAGVKLGQSIGISVINALNGDYVDASDNPVQSRGFYVHYKISH